MPIVARACVLVNLQVDGAELNIGMDERAYYIEQHRLAHENPREFRGRALPGHVAHIDQLCQQHGCRTILDYGCGKAQCWPAHWQGRVTGYDPAYGPYSTRPRGQYDMVICTEVMEHVPESAVAETLRHIFQLGSKWAYLSICTRPSDKLLPDGSNKHLTVRPQEWWDQQLRSFDHYTVHYH